MAHHLYLTSDEQKLFTALPKNLQGQWEMTEEKGGYEDDPRTRALRVAFLAFESPVLREFKTSVAKLKNPAEFHAMVQKVDLTKVSEQDLAELMFAIGSEGMTAIIKSLLATVSQPADLERIALIAAIRHVFYETSSVSA